MHKHFNHNRQEEHMAEIRSTMDMVMERAAKMAAEAKSDSSGDDVVHEGMRYAALYLQGDDINLTELLEKQKEQDQRPFMRGIADILLRNIVLPRDEMLLEGSLKALNGVAVLAGGDVSSLCQELQQILGQYSQHKEQMRQQLDDAIRSQLKQQLAKQGTQLTDDMNINPAMHPQYQEELDKMLTDLNGQYNEALDQRKAQIRERLLPAQ